MLHFLRQEGMTIADVETVLATQCLPEDSQGWKVYGQVSFYLIRVKGWRLVYLEELLSLAILFSGGGPRLRVFLYRRLGH